MGSEPVLSVRRAKHTRMKYTDVLTSHTSKNNHIPMTALAAALYEGLTCAPGTGPLFSALFDIWVVFSRALTAHHIANNDIAAARQTKSYQRTSVSSTIKSICMRWCIPRSPKDSGWILLEEKSELRGWTWSEWDSRSSGSGLQHGYFDIYTESNPFLRRQ